MSSQQTLGFGRFLLDFVAATFRTRQRSLAAMRPVPTSSRRKRNHVSYEIDEEVVIRAPFLANPTLVDEDVGDEPPVASPQENVDLEEVNDFPGHRSVPRTPTFDDNGFEEYKMDERYVSSRDDWILSLIGKSFHYKELELEDDLVFKDRHPTNIFTIHSVQESIRIGNQEVDQ